MNIKIGISRNMKYFSNFYLFAGKTISLQKRNMNIDKSKLKIHKIGVEEIPILIEYRLSYLAELQGTRDEKYNTQLKKDLEIYFRKSLEEGRFFALYAELEEKILSFGGMIIKEIPGDASKSSYLEGDILNMYTVPEARRQGISSMILEQLLKEAKSMGISKVALHTSKDGEIMYRKSGFAEPVHPYLELVINPENFKH
jgi:GNAT superfamily N-acetyltransferase